MKVHMRTAYRVREQFGHEFHIRQGQGFLSDNTIIQVLCIKKLQHSTLNGKEWPEVEIDPSSGEEEVDDTEAIDQRAMERRHVIDEDADDEPIPPRRRRRRVVDEEDDDEL